MRRVRMDWENSICKRLIAAASSKDIVFLTMMERRLYRSAAKAARRWWLGRLGGEIANVVKAKVTNMVHEVSRQGHLDRLLMRRSCPCHDEKRQFILPQQAAVAIDHVKK